MSDHSGMLVRLGILRFTGWHSQNNPGWPEPSRRGDILIIAGEAATRVAKQRVIYAT